MTAQHKGSGSTAAARTEVANDGAGVAHHGAAVANDGDDRHGVMEREGKVHHTPTGEKYHHGRTPAAWTGMAIALVGSLVATVGFFLNINWLVVAIGLALMVVAAIVGGVMRKMGYGQE